MPRKAYFMKSHTPLEVGDVVQNCGDGTKFMQVEAVTKRTADLASFGKVRKGVFYPSKITRRFKVDKVGFHYLSRKATSSGSYQKVVKIDSVSGWPND